MKLVGRDGHHMNGNNAALLSLCIRIGENVKGTDCEGARLANAMRVTEEEVQLQHYFTWSMYTVKQLFTMP
jgi:hypothetical protein